PPDLGGALHVALVVDEPDAARVVGGLAAHRGGGVELLALQADAQKILVILEDVELEVVLLEHADAVDVALGQVLVAAGVAAELQENRVTIEGALSFAAGVELVGDLFEQALRLDQVAVALVLVAVPAGG